MIKDIKSGNFDNVNSLLQSKVSANFIDHEGFSPIIWACSCNKLEIAKLLVKFKADPAYIAPDASSALICAAGEGSVDICTYLLSCPGVTVNSEDNHRLNPLIMAVSQGHLDTAKFLLDAKADPNLSFSLGSPLLQATGEGNQALLELLLQYGADPNKAHTKSGITPLFLAIGKKDIVATYKLLKAKGDVDHRTVKGRSPIQLAMDMEAANILRVLVKRTSHINESHKLHDGSDQTPLLFAVDINNRKLLETVLKCKADVNKPNSKGMTPLLMAAQFGDVAIVRVFDSNNYRKMFVVFYTRLWVCNDATLTL